MSEKIPICDVSDIAEGSSRGISFDNDEQDRFFIVRHNGKLRAWMNACPHINGAPMAWKKDAYLNPAKTHITCFAHGALFDPDTGICVRGPCVGKRLQMVKIYVDDNGMVMADSRHNKYEEQKNAGS